MVKNPADKRNGKQQDDDTEPQIIRRIKDTKKNFLTFNLSKKDANSVQIRL